MSLENSAAKEIRSSFRRQVVFHTIVVIVLTTLYPLQYIQACNHLHHCSLRAVWHMRVPGMCYVGGIIRWALYSSVPLLIGTHFSYF